MKTGILLFLLGLSSLMKAQEISCHLIVMAKDSTKVAYSLNDEPKVTFQGETIVISAKDVLVEYQFSDIDRFFYEDRVVSSVENTTQESYRFICNGEYLMFCPSNQKCQVSIWDMAGKVLIENLIDATEVYTVPLSSFERGIYLVKINDVTYKFIKR